MKYLWAFTDDLWDKKMIAKKASVYIRWVLLTKVVCKIAHFQVVVQNRSSYQIEKYHVTKWQV